jgi:hypothetical protein
MKKYIFTAVVALVVILGVGFSMQSPEQSNENISGLSERDIKATSLEVSGQTGVKQFRRGGTVASLVDATGGAYTLSESELSKASVLKFAAGGAGQEVIQLTLPNATSSAFNTALPNVGDSRTWIYDASALAAATTTTVTAPTYSVDLIAYTTNDDVIDGLEFAELSCWRESSILVKCITSELVHAD